MGRSGPEQLEKDGGKERQQEAGDHYPYDGFVMPAEEFDHGQYYKR